MAAHIRCKNGRTRFLYSVLVLQWLVSAGVGLRPHRNFTSPGISAGCPHLLRRFYHARLYDWTEVSLSRCMGYGRRGCRPHSCRLNMARSRPVGRSWRICGVGFSVRPYRKSTDLRPIQFSMFCERMGVENTPFIYQFIFRAKSEPVRKDFLKNFPCSVSRVQ